MRNVFAAVREFQEETQIACCFFQMRKRHCNGRRHQNLTYSKTWAKELAPSDIGSNFEQEKFLTQIEESEREEENKPFTLAPSLSEEEQQEPC